MRFVFAALVLVLGIIPILLTERQRRLGRNLLHGGPEFIGVDSWCERHLGVWWAARAGIPGSALVLCLWLPAATAFSMLIVAFGWVAWQHIAHVLGLDWPGKDRLNHYYQRLNNLQNNPHFCYLDNRNETLEIVFYVLMFVGLLIPMLLMVNFELYDRSDWHVMWLLFFGFGLMVSLPMLFLGLYTLPQGWPRLREFIEYEEVKNPEGWPRGWPWIALAFFLLTVVSAVMIARTATF